MNKNAIFVMIALVFVPAMQVSAQVQQNRQSLIERLRTELENTDELIRRAEEAVQSSNSPTGKMALEKAIQLQELAWTNFHKRTQAGYEAAVMFTKQARELAQRAIGTSRLTEENEDIILRKLERVTEQMQRLREEAPPDVAPQLKSLYESALVNLERAWEFYRAHRFRPAVKLCTQVEKTVQKLFNALRQQDRQWNDLERRGEKVQDLLDRLSERIGECGKEKAEMLLENARNAFRQAQEMRDQRRMEGARAALYKANQLANMAAEICRGGNDDLESRWERIKNSTDRLREQVSPDDENALRMFGQIYRQLELAKEHYEAGQRDAAAASLKAAELTLRQLKRYMKNGGF